jgi:hypothetical protein
MSRLQRQFFDPSDSVNLNACMLEFFLHMEGAWSYPGLMRTHTIRRSTMQHPSAHRRVGKVSKPSDRQSVKINVIPRWQSGISARLWSPVDFTYARRRIIHQNPESTGATLPMALSPKSAIMVSVLRTGSWSTWPDHIEKIQDLCYHSQSVTRTKCNLVWHVPTIFVRLSSEKLHGNTLKVTNHCVSYQNEHDKNNHSCNKYHNVSDPHLHHEWQWLAAISPHWQVNNNLLRFSGKQLHERLSFVFLSHFQKQWDDPVLTSPSTWDTL